GYDGKGQSVVETVAAAERAFSELNQVPCILEGFVNFEREVSLIAARSADGQIECYPLVENHHESGILRLTLAPAPALSNELQNSAERRVRLLLSHLDYVGVVTVEFFQTNAGLVANEFAPRVHNSGHWSIEGAKTSQFENHLRAIVGLPLGDTAVRGHVAMLNLVGAVPEPHDLLGVSDAHLHLYGKAARPGRKVGHVTVISESSAERSEKLRRLIPVLVRSGCFPETLFPY
ncbi:MAG TPA: ATP-grasp domain-containing protein, partial [Polyangiaceae bacterium]